MNEESKIFEKVRQGDMKAFELLFRTYYKELCNHAYQYLHDKDAAEEIVQDLFFKLWLKKNTLIIKTSVRSYLYRAVYNNTMLFLREKNTKDLTHKIPDYLEQKLIDEPDVQIQVSELDYIIQKTIGSMPQNVKRIFELSRFEGLKYKEIAEKLSISVKTVEANMGKALKLFRKSLKDW